MDDTRKDSAAATPLKTVGDSLFWSYANLAMMTAVLESGATRPGRTHFMIRSRLYAGLRKGSMRVRGYFDDEKLKLKFPDACWYCGSMEQLSVDHVIPQCRRGTDAGENLIWSCRRCNSSKGSKDLLDWMGQRGTFPPLYLLRRYLKMAIGYCRTHGLLSTPLSEAATLRQVLPFALHLVPHAYPPAADLCLWARRCTPCGGTEYGG